MSLVSIVEALEQRALTSGEAGQLNALQRQFAVADDDPIMVVLALVARSQIIFGSMPEVLRTEVNQTIELHKSMLRDQSVLIAKELIAILANDIEIAVLKKHKRRWVRYAGVFFVGVLVGAVLFGLRRYFGH